MKKMSFPDLRQSLQWILLISLVKTRDYKQGYTKN